jgi:hypothetical protein
MFRGFAPPTAAGFYCFDMKFLGDTATIIVNEVDTLR